MKVQAAKQGLTLSEVVDRALRQGVSQVGNAAAIAYECPAFSMGYPPRVDLDRALDLAAALEDDEIRRKIEVHK